MKTVEFKRVEFDEGEAFSWKATLQDFMKSPMWGQKHPLEGVKDIKLALKVQEVLDAEGLTADDEVIDYICDMAAAIPFMPGAKQDRLKAIIEFKEYFADLKKQEGKSFKKVK